MSTGDADEARLPAPRPEVRRRNPEPSPADRPPPHPEDDDLSDEGADPLDTLLDPSAWPDDAEEPTVPEGLLEPEFEDPLDDLVAPDDDVPFDLPEEDPLDDELESLDAPDDTEVPILPWTLEVRVDGRPVPAQVEPRLTQTVWYTSANVAGPREVTLELAGKRLRIVVQVQPADQPGVALGRDVLSGRFLLRP